MSGLESIAPEEWRPRTFLVVAQLDIERSCVESSGIAVVAGDGEELAYIRVSSGQIYALFKMPENPVPGYALLCADPGGMDWRDALDLFLAESDMARSRVIWVPSDEDGYQGQAGSN